jgi:4-hydroxy-tetrahydrodipicolinate synthase
MRTKYRNGANVTVVKEALQIQGLAVGDVRLPGLPKLETADRKALEKVVAGWETDAIV